VAELAAALGNTADAAAYSALRTSLLSEYNAAFLNANGVYGHANGDGLQSAHALSLDIGAAGSAGSPAFKAAVDLFAKDISVTHNGAWMAGISGTKAFHGTLTAGGYGELAVTTLLQTSYPSFGYMFNNDDEPGTTLWELPDGNSEGPGMNSRNHHMFSSPGAWLYKDLAGIKPRSPANATLVGFAHAVIYPRVTGHAALPFVTASYTSVAGHFASTWSNVSGVRCASGGESTTATFACSGKGVITAVQFASFGTPTGTCGAFSLGACNAANSTAIVSAACLGKSSCSIAVGDSLFGDPCFNTVKSFAGQVLCDVEGIALEVTIPANARATVRMPLDAARPFTGLTVTEGGATVFAAGAFVPGVAGVTGAALHAADATLDLEVGSGDYGFVSSQ